MAEAEVKCPFCERIDAVKKYILDNAVYQHYHCQSHDKIISTRTICNSMI